MEKNSLISPKSINKEKFITLINNHKAQEERLDKLSEAGFQIWETAVIEYGNELFDELIYTFFTEEGSDWIFWWLFEKNDNPEMKAYYENNEEIPLDTIEEFWEFVKQYRR